MPGLQIEVLQRMPRAARQVVDATADRMDGVVGGAARRRVIVMLALVLALDAADKGALAATAVQVEHYFHITKTDLGILGSVSSGATALATLPFGAMVDRVTRTRVLGGAVVVWAVAMCVSGVATSYLFLLVARVVLGLATGVAYPAVASLIGDYFPVAERGRVYGWVLSGELVGTGFGIAIAGGAASVFDSWRAAEFVLALPAVLLAWRLWRFPEPARGGASRMPRGQRRLLSAQAVDSGASADAGAQAGEASPPGDLARVEVRGHGVQPREELVIRNEDPRRWPLWRAVRYVLSIPTNVVLIVASALGYFFFSGLRYFGIQFAQQHYHLSHGAASGLVFLLGLGALAGVLVGGRLGDTMLKNGHVGARVAVPAVTFTTSALLFAPGLWVSSVAIAVALLLAVAFAFAASNPPLDAARLDVMVPYLWGRAEATRSAIRGVLEAIAPVTFGLVADNLFGGRGSGGLMLTFLLMLVPLLVAGAVLLLALRTYPPDVATADATVREFDAEPAS